MLVRVSIGSLVALKDASIKVSANPGLVYVMQHSPSGCAAACAFCTQGSMSASSKDFLSRVVWPAVELDSVIRMVKRSHFQRVCLQTVIKEGFIEEALDLTAKFSAVGRGVSVSITPIPTKLLKAFVRNGADYLGVGLDAASAEIAYHIMKPYPWKLYWRFIEEGVKVFGEGRVVTHIIVGLGESVRDFLETVEKLYKLGSEVSLFAFTPMKGTLMESHSGPSIREYRFAQLATYLISKGFKWREFTIFRGGKPYIKSEFLEEVAKDFRPFLTRGCPGCNRPFYTERPGEELYNFPDSDSLRRWEGRLVEELISLKV
ncbi:MAG: radical SAM protein [Desulfurococcales archaeon]|nr:radical SAM protein [Desulfurococcales archaeon]